MNKYKAGEVQLCNGRSRNMPPRTIASTLRLDSNAMLTFIGFRANEKDKNNADAIYRIDGSDVAVIVSHKGNGFDTASLDTQYFKRQREHGQQVNQVAQSVGIPFATAMAIGTDRETLKDFKDAVYLISRTNLMDNKQRDELMNCDVNRRKELLKEVLGENISNKIGLDNMGSKNTERIASYVVGVYNQVAQDHQNYASACEAVSKKVDLHFNVVLSIGPDKQLCEQFKKAVNYAVNNTSIITDDLKHTLKEGTLQEKKDAMKEVVGDELYSKLNINTMSEKKLNRLTTHVCYVHDKMLEKRAELAASQAAQTEPLNVNKLSQFAKDSIVPVINNPEKLKVVIPLVAANDGVDEATLHKYVDYLREQQKTAEEAAQAAAKAEAKAQKEQAKATKQESVEVTEPKDKVATIIDELGPRGVTAIIKAKDDPSTLGQIGKFFDIDKDTMKEVIAKIEENEAQSEAHASHNNDGPAIGDD